MPTLYLIISYMRNHSFRSRLIHLSYMNSPNHEYEFIADIGDRHFECSSGLDFLCFYQTGYVGKVSLYNPITKKTLPLPVLSDFASRDCLGYVSSTNEYKVVVSFEGKVDDSDDWKLYYDFEELLCFNILTLKLEEQTSVVGSWRDLSLTWSTQYSGTFHQPIHVNGFTYWLAYAKGSTCSSYHMTILEMNLENEDVNALSLPNGYRNGCFHLACINEHLCFVENNTDGPMLNI
ncbi:hypothetical protein FXO38_32130 [Capsicum annuum]|nr:hypothetical protein FXO38_32130 [Capsicum annuum]KAF3621739.1 hypothetical protein FXO37_32634 [Capsicum annuum]